MTKRNIFNLALSALILNAGLFSAANAAELRLKCEKRGNRSTVSVDGRSVSAGNYYAAIASGGNSATSDPQASVAGEVQIDFDSNNKDIANGATAISSGFIQGGQVSATLYTADDFVVISGSANCRVR